MGIGDKLIGAVGDKSREISEKLSQKYRDHVGEELSKKQTQLDAMKENLAEREKAIAEREVNIRKFYLIPKRYIDIPIAGVFLVALYFGFQFFSPLAGSSTNSSSSVSNSPVDNSPARATPTHSTCVQKGIAYYKEIGSYPSLSTGEDAENKVEGMCRRSQGLAFGS
jgi:hypothetical protein